MPFDFDLMAEKTQAMLRKGIDALINKEMYDWVKQSILQRPEDIESLIHLLSVSRHLERIGNHATNIAEDVIYMAEGLIIRHKTENYE